MYARVEVHPAGLVLVLDYSGSMSLPFDEMSRLESVKSAVIDLVGQGLPIDYGAVLFSTDVIDTVSIGPDAGSPSSPQFPPTASPTGRTIR